MGDIVTLTGGIVIDDGNKTPIEEKEITIFNGGSGVICEDVSEVINELCNNMLSEAMQKIQLVGDDFKCIMVLTFCENTNFKKKVAVYANSVMMRDGGEELYDSFIDHIDEWKFTLP